MLAYACTVGSKSRECIYRDLHPGEHETKLDSWRTVAGVMYCLRVHFIWQMQRTSQLLSAWVSPENPPTLKATSVVQDAAGLSYQVLSGGVGRDPQAWMFCGFGITMKLFRRKPQQSRPSLITPRKHGSSNAKPANQTLKHVRHYWCKLWFALNLCFQR